MRNHKVNITLALIITHSPWISWKDHLQASTGSEFCSSIVSEHLATWTDDVGAPNSSLAFNWHLSAIQNAGLESHQKICRITFSTQFQPGWFGHSRRTCLSTPQEIEAGRHDFFVGAPALHHHSINFPQAIKNWIISQSPLGGWTDPFGLTDRWLCRFWWIVFIFFHCGCFIAFLLMYVTTKSFFIIIIAVEYKSDQ